MDIRTEDGGADGDTDGGADGAVVRPAFASVPLLPRELEVLRLAAGGFAAPEIAFVFGLTRGMVEELLGRCVWRLRATDINDAIAEARWREILDY